VVVGEEVEVEVEVSRCRKEGASPRVHDSNANAGACLPYHDYRGPWRSPWWKTERIMVERK
jgi:hypothetical protein